MPRQISEDRIRKEMIDSQLEQAGWRLCDLAIANLLRRRKISCMLETKP
jgi:hypothetical protein